MKKLLLFGAISCLMFAGATSVSASAKIEHPENFKVTKSANQEALEKIKEFNENPGNKIKIDLSKAPVPVENITTQIPQEAKAYEIMRENKGALDKASLRRLPISKIIKSVIWDPTYAVGDGIQCNEIVPLNFVARENAIPSTAVVHSADNHSFIHDLNFVSDSKTGGYGDGGYYWRLFNYKTYYGYSVAIWLSAWDLNHLVYN
jgi:hypothetical protein